MTLLPEGVAELAFNERTEPPGIWVWHQDQTDEWNRRAEAHWETLVEEMRQELEADAAAKKGSATWASG
jgi:hypothetical protein